MIKALAVSLLLLFTFPVLADERQEQLIGVWRLQTYEVEFQDTGERTAPFGAHPNGIGIFTPEGRTIGILTAEGRKAPQTDADRAEAFRSMIAYSGIYRLEEDRWITKVDIAWNEARNGTEQVRYYSVEGDALTVTTPWMPQLNHEGRIGRGVLTWVRVR
jgi:hypothetical protein